MGCRSVPTVLAKPSIVVTDLPSAATVRSVQLFMETPSTWTTQAPHCEVSQPIWVPVRSSISRRKSDRSSDGATSALTFLPLTDISTFMCVLLLYLDQRPLPRGHASSKHPRLVPLPARQHD